MGDRFAGRSVAWRRRVLTVLCTFAVALATLQVAPPTASAAPFDPCAPGSNPIVCENSKPGTPASEWDVPGAGDPSIQGFATDMSVNVGETIGFKVDTDASAYDILIYRLGWYGGDGARLIDTVSPSVPLPQDQPSCLYDDDTGLIDCGNWSLSATWTVPSDAVSGIYIARLLRSDTHGDSHIVFVVRDDSSQSDMVFQTSDTTWQAYNQYGGNSLYHGAPWGRALKVSYNRPFTVRFDTPDGRDSVFGSEYAMVRWLERNGYDVSYISGIDTDRYGATLLGNHDVFLSVGHDEYWSGPQRANVEAARDAGMHLAFLSGNEVFWRTRWEPSIDGSENPYRTLVTYKETHENERVDPSGEWTGTWRDPRFLTADDGVEPENSLTGSLFMVMCCTYALRVPASYGDLRFWRNTAVADLAPGEEAVLPWGTLGYEWNEDIDNGFRPAGAFRMSETTETVERRLIDYGTETEEAVATHHLMTYRAASGALVWSAGTTQWSWGLDDYHDGPDTETSAIMQQATVNMFADMGVQPATLQAGLVPATPSTDTTAPVVSITSPASGEAIERGAGVTVTGTAIDSGGVVAGVEVSIDGGATWRRADGRGQWSFTGGLSSIGPLTIMARAVDDSGNLGSAAAVDVDMTCPCQIFSAGDVPEVEAFDDPVALELGVKFQTEFDGVIEGVRFYKGPGNTGTHVGSLWSASGNLLARATFTGETATGWQQVLFPEPVAVTAGTTYVASYHAPNGHYPGDTDWFLDGPTLSPPLRALQNGEEGPNGVYREGSEPGFPTQSFRARNYWVDVIFDGEPGADATPPYVLSASPSSGSWGVDTATNVSVTFNEPIVPDSLQLGVAAESTVVEGAVSYDEATRTATFEPEAPLEASTAYTVTVSATDLAGNAMAAPHEHVFTTGLASDDVVVLWDTSTVPGTIDDSDTQPLTLGVKFTADTHGVVSGIRFYKGPSNTGTHIGSLWDGSGNLLAEATFVNESPSGWQQVLFDTPVPIEAGVTYVASYHTPMSRFSADRNYFLASHSNGPLTAPSSVSSGGNGVYAYGVTPTFPTGMSGHANYWVTPVFQPGVDAVPIRVVSTSPAPGDLDVELDAPISIEFDSPADPDTVEITVSTGGNDVSGSIDIEPDAIVATFTPAADLAPGTVYSVSVSASDVAGNAMSQAYEFTFLTQSPGVMALWDSSARPAVVNDSDTQPLTLGVKFTSDIRGVVTGIRFYKGPSNTGTHIGSLWDGSGNLLAEATFVDESPSGWQQVLFDTPVPIEAGDVYVASYHTPTSRFSADRNYFVQSHSNGPLTAPSSGSSGGNGVYAYGTIPTFPTGTSGHANYWVTPLVLDADAHPPVVVETSPAAGALDVPVGAAVTVTFDEEIDGGELDFSMTSGGVPIAGDVTIEGASATFTPAADLDPGTVYTVSVAASDLFGNAAAAPYQFLFTTEVGELSALWDASAEPAVVNDSDTAALTLGVKFTSEEPGDVVGLRFYKGPANTGTHIGSLWDGSGNLLAEATFVDETSSGWQQVLFDAPVAIQPGVTYVASYLTPTGVFSADRNYFVQSHSSGPLTAPSSGSSGGNGVYAYGATPTFPTGTSGHANYWVTPLFRAADDVASPAVLSTSPADGAIDVDAETAVSVVFDEDVEGVAVSVSSAAGLVAGDVSVDGAEVTFTPGVDLEPGTVYSVSVSASDLVGNAMTAPFQFSFTTQSGLAALWDTSAVPAVIDDADTGALTLGVKFFSDEPGDVVGVRFYKGPSNTGTHVGSLWDASGNLLAEATFVDETPSGWQQVMFDTPVTIQAGATYVVSYHTPTGRFSADRDYFLASHTSGPLTAPASGPSGGNGVFAYGATPTFPTGTSGHAHYWVTPLVAVGVVP